MFGRDDANLPPSLATTPSLRYGDLLQLWKERHEEYLRKVKEKIQLQKEKNKKLQDSLIVLPTKNIRTRRASQTSKPQQKQAGAFAGKGQQPY